MGTGKILSVLNCVVDPYTVQIFRSKTFSIHINSDHSYLGPHGPVHMERYASPRTRNSKTIGGLHIGNGIRGWIVGDEQRRVQCVVIVAEPIQSLVPKHTKRLRLHQVVDVVGKGRIHFKKRKRRKRWLNSYSDVSEWSKHQPIQARKQTNTGTGRMRKNKMLITNIFYRSGY